MLKVSVWGHKDGDHLVIVRVPWYYHLVIRLNDALFCPCHGLSGLLSRIPIVELWFFKLWNNKLHYKWSLEKEVELMRFPIEHSCEVSQLLWPQEDYDGTCYHYPDAYSEVFRDMA